MEWIKLKICHRFTEGSTRCEIVNEHTFFVIVAEYKYVLLSFGMILRILSTYKTMKNKIDTMFLDTFNWVFNLRDFTKSLLQSKRTYKGLHLVRAYCLQFSMSTLCGRYSYSHIVKNERSASKGLHGKENCTFDTGSRCTCS